MTLFNQRLGHNGQAALARPINENVVDGLDNCACNNRAKMVAAEGAARREDGARRLAAVVGCNIPTLNPSSSWLGDEVERATLINTSMRHSRPTSQRDDLYVMQTFVGVTCGVLQTVLPTKLKVRLYTYSDKDPFSKRMARTKLRSLQA